MSTSPPVVTSSGPATAPATKTTVPAVPMPASAAREGVQIVAPLFRAIGRISESPTLAHNMQLSFNSALRTVHGPMTRYGHHHYYNRLLSSGLVIWLWPDAVKEYLSSCS